MLTVSSLVRLVRARLETDYGDLLVEGELTDFARPRSGHLYFTLRDERGDAALRAVMWASEARRLRFEPRDGERVRARGTLTLYEARGAFQLRVSRLEPVGEGELRLRFERALARLQARGLLDPSRKRALPWSPRRIGVVTSRDSAALRDILKVLGDRLPVPVLIAHAAVQGEVAPGEIVVALSRLARVGDVEVVIVGRGGGGGDDLWAWNDEAVALAIAEHPVPVVTAIGHETDTTLADLVADRRAATPSEAAMLVSPDREALREALISLSRRLTRAQRLGLERRQARLALISGRLPEPWQLLDGSRQRIDELSRRLEASCRGELGRSRERLGQRVAALEALSPLEVLGRGYGLVTGEGGVAITRASEVSPGDPIEVRLQEGALDCLVRKVRG